MGCMEETVRIQSTWLLVPLLFLLPACTHHCQLIKKNVSVCYKNPPRITTATGKNIKLPTLAEQEASKKFPNITVWIHGTKFVRNDMFKITFNGVPDIKHIRDCPAAHRLQYHMRLLDRDAPSLFAYDSLYLFGWSGRLSTRERYWAALILYQKLCVLSDEYKKEHGVEPCIRLITHSHGGNVALNLARIHKQRKGELNIDMLVLLACPVQRETQDLAFDPLFKRIYALYSSLDMVQILAPEFIYNMRNDDGSIIGKCLRLLPFSDRRFTRTAPVRQAWVKFNGTALMHSKFTSTYFLRTLPTLLQELDGIYDQHFAQLIQECKEVLLHIKSHCINER
jgi:pimeloyl-ACP methyl ester carboxylesterase